ncbi:MAG: hypothetical protein GY750_20930 [Lentisphaerae bacterium]|nr:hypothetical protein [Lentisphaerota bacterium]
MSEINEICGNCFHVETKDGSDCVCALDNDFEGVYYFDEGCDCFLNRSDVFNNERLVNFD